MATPFQRKHTLEARVSEAARMLAKYPDRVPVIVQPDPRTKPPPIDKEKYLVPRDITLGQFLHCLRVRLKLHEATALFLLVGSELLPMSRLAGDAYESKRDPDGFLYVTYSTESAFGCFTLSAAVRRVVFAASA